MQTETVVNCDLLISTAIQSMHATSMMEVSIVGYHQWKNITPHRV